MAWSKQQEAVLKEVKAWLKDEDGPQVYTLFGFAGTGKTTLAKEFGSEVETVLYGAFTGKAADVLRKKGCKGATTIHGMIYVFNGFDHNGLCFKLDPNSPVTKADLVVIDEVSMVGEKLGQDLLSFKKKVLVIGDPAQLPPVKSAGFFTNNEPDYMLTEVHRQARDNPIIRLSMEVREHKILDYGDFGAVKVIRSTEIEESMILEADQVIVGLNRTRFNYNRRIRELLGYHGDFPEKNEKLICLKNDHELGIFNGGIWNVNKVEEKKEIIKLGLIPEDGDKDDSRLVKVKKEFFLGKDKQLNWKDKRGTQEFTYGYAITCHKSQGSQWRSVMLFDEGAVFGSDRFRWLYTGITRAAEELIVVR